MIVLGAKGEFCVFTDKADDCVGCESWGRKLGAEVECGSGCEKKKVPIRTKKRLDHQRGPRWINKQ